MNIHATFRRIVQTRFEDKTENSGKSGSFCGTTFVDTIASVILKLGRFEYFSHSFSWFPSLYSILPGPERGMHRKGSAWICRLHPSNTRKRSFKFFYVKIGLCRRSKPTCYYARRTLFTCPKKANVFVSPAVTLAQFTAETRHS